MLAEELRTLSDHAWQRTRDRLDGMTDEEYFWEPAPSCWSIRRAADGQWQADGTPGPQDPSPFTTVAWRLWHLIDMYGEDRAPVWLGVEPRGQAIGLDGPEGPPGSAAEALSMLERAHARWDAHLDLADDAILRDPIGPVAGPFADATKAAYVLHMLDEFIHHGAELGVLRDLWRAQS